MATIVDSINRMGPDRRRPILLADRPDGKQNSTVSLAQLIKEVRDEMQPDTKGRDIASRIGELSELQGDRSTLRLAFVNLISNAIKFTRKRPQAQIVIRCLEKKVEAVTLAGDVISRLPIVAGNF
jgi:signal transduction histidine kinase